jgi:hypothetical protein
LNVAYYQPISVDKITPATGGQYMIEVWVYISTYMNGTFPGMDINWDKFARIDVNPDKNNSQIITGCYPFVDITSFSSYTFKITDTSAYSTWTFVRCSVNTPLNQVFINYKAPVKIEMAVPAVNPSSSSLLIRDYSTDSSYGLALVRELRLWSGANYLFYDTSRVY